MGGEYGDVDEAGTRVRNRLADSTVHGTVVQAGRADVLIRTSDPVEQAVPVTVAPPLGLRDASRPLRGRGDVLARLEAAPAGDGLLVLCGMGGCGKTALALELAARRTAAGYRVWWVEARNGPALEAALRAVARQVGAAPEELERGDTADVLWSRLARLDAPWLLVVDNADDPALLDGPGALNAGTGWIRPATGAGTVLVTSRESTPATWGPAARLHPLQPLTGDRLDDAARILRDHAPATAGAEAESHALADRLGGLPLALYLAGAYLTEATRTPAPFRAPGTPTTYAAYRRAWEDGPQGLDPAHVLPRTWAMSLDLLEQRGHTHARRLLELIASFADADLPYTLLLTPDRLADTGPLAELDGPALWQHLTALAALGLIDLPEAAPDTLPVLRLHPLVRDASRTPETEATAAGILAAVALDDENGHPEEYESWERWRLLSPHVLNGFRNHGAARVPEADVPHLAEAAGLAGWHLCIEGLYARARTELEAVLTVKEAYFEDGDPSLLTTRFCHAVVLRCLGELEEARTEFEAILAIERTRYGDTGERTLDTRHQRGVVLNLLGESEAARAEFEAVLAAHRARAGDTDRSALVARYGIGGILYERGELGAARAEFEAILAVERTRYGGNHPEVLSTRLYLALILRDQGELEAARAEFEAVLAARRGRPDEHHPDALATRSTYADLLGEMGELGRARAEYEVVFAARRAGSGDTHPETLVARHNLAVALYELGELEAARAEFEAVLAIERDCWGDSHHGSLPTRDRLARVLRELGESEAARAEFEALLAVRTAQLGETHADTRATARRLAEVLRELES
ncbi:tetratricopeptide repeat protein [Kitasatospora sp. NPDC057692]|uniref:tetratricopeptide repeat protein n=1 Tax=Kitasatospora sp. NPDC057692 TaxID=3346215 RepID=UPI0036B4D856